jgi:hypothetical protein
MQNTLKTVPDRNFFAFTPPTSLTTLRFKSKQILIYRAENTKASGAPRRELFLAKAEQPRKHPVVVMLRWFHDKPRGQVLQSHSGRWGKTR